MKYFDIESLEILTAEQLKDEFYGFIANDGEHDGWTFDDYIKECTGKNGTLITIDQAVKTGRVKYDFFGEAYVVLELDY